MKIELYADGSGNTFDSDGGYGWRLVVDDVLVQEGNGYLPKATNNVAELTAAVKGLEAVEIYLSSIKKEDNEYTVTLVSDSQLVLGYANGTYKCKAFHLTTLFIQLQKVYKGLKATTRWVKGHSGNEHNDGCDRLASQARLGKGTSGLV
jgi:ribonuclease HI